MAITERTLAQAWQRTAAGHPLLDEVGLPPVALTDDELEEWAERAEEAGDGGLCLLLDREGTVHGRQPTCGAANWTSSTGPCAVPSWITRN